MNPYNTVALMGRLTKDPEVRYTQANMAICKFSLAVDRQGKEKETDFPNCVAFGKTAENMGKYLAKGCRVVVFGSIKTGSYEGKNGKVYTTDVNVFDMFFIDFKDSGKTYKEEKPETEYRQQDFIDVDDEGDLPF